MQLDDLAGSAIRVSGGWGTTPADWAAFADAWIAAHTSFVARRRAPAA
jgi:cysteine desulfurase